MHPKRWKSIAFIFYQKAICMMKILLFLFLFCSTTWQAGQAQQSSTDTFTVYIFLLEDCVISQNCTATLRQLHKEYACEQIQFVGLFPNHFSKKRSIRRFRKKFQIPFELRQDPHQALARRVGATITPDWLFGTMAKMNWSISAGWTIPIWPSVSAGQPPLPMN